MTRKRVVLAVALLATAAWTGPSQALYHDFWPASADGSMNTHPSEGYSIQAEGQINRLAKTYQHFGFAAFGAPSDGPDLIQYNRPGDKGDGVLLADWLTDKKIVRASIYLRDYGNNYCTPLATNGTYMNSPTAILGFRCANAGPFIDRASSGSGHGGCCAPYSAPLVKGGENAPAAWRIGAPPYAVNGDAGAGAEWYLVSSRDSTNPNQPVNSGQNFFDSGHTGFGGLSGTANRFAFGWVVANSDTHITNSQTLEEADCQGTSGGDEPRDAAKDTTAGFGWYGERLDRVLVSSLANDPEVKGIVFSSLAVTSLFKNFAVYTRDQSAGQYGWYLDITATLPGDVNNNGTVDIFDLLSLAAAWNTNSSDTAYNEDADFDLNGAINIFDLLSLAKNWNTSIP